MELLTHFSYAMNLKQSEELLYTVVTDSDAQMIKAQMNTFNGIEQQLCFIHFCKNIKNKMKYQLKKKPSADQIKDYEAFS